MLKFLVFSKNRACQLDLLIRSIKKFCQIPKELYEISILYTYTDNHKSSYDICYSKFPNINWNKEYNFEQQAKDLLNFGKSNLICLLTDDTVFFQDFNLPFKTFGNNTFSWRLGYNTYIQDHVAQRKQPHLVPDECRENLFSWNPCKYPEWCNYGYPFSFDGHVYSAELLNSLMVHRQFKNTNEMEGILHSQRNVIENIFCNAHSSCVNVPCNNLSGLTMSGQVHEYSMDYLKSQYEQNKRIKFIDYTKNPILGCHQEMELEFYDEI